MSHPSSIVANRLTGHALRNANLRKRSLARAEEAPPLARALVTLRADILGMTRLEFARRSGISRGTLRDLELGIHTPTRRILQQFVDFCRSCGATSHHLDEVCDLYIDLAVGEAGGRSGVGHRGTASPGSALEEGSADGLRSLIARLELRAGSPAELARRANISPATLWAYRRGNFPLPLSILRRLCEAVGEDSAAAEVVWQAAQRQRFVARGYPLPLAEFWTLCARGEYAEKHLPSLGLGMAALRRLRYLELPEWEEVATAARALCRGEQELQNLERLWREVAGCDNQNRPDPFGALLQQLRKAKGLTRREVADLFKVGGKKPAQVIQSIEEEGCYSARAHPAGLAALLAREAAEQRVLLELWEERRKQFHRRHRPETRLDLRLARERYGFEHADMEPILGYTPLEYQRMERGVGPLADTARVRILQAIHRAGQHRVEALLQEKEIRDAQRAAWRVPSSVRQMVSSLAEREGGIIPLMRCLREAGVTGMWAERLRALERGEQLPPWPLVERIGRACAVEELDPVRCDWREHYRRHLQGISCSPLGIEVRLLIAEVACTVREFSKRLGVHASGLTRDLQRIDRGRPVKWFHVERILRSAGLVPGDRRWEQIHAWWYAARIEGSPSPGQPER